MGQPSKWGYQMGKPHSKHHRDHTNRPHFARVAVNRVQSLFVQWTPGCYKQVLLAALGLVMLGMASWIVLFDVPPAPGTGPDWRFRDVVLILLAWAGLAGLEDLGWTVARHEIHARTGQPVRMLIGNFVLLAANQVAILIAVDVFGLRVHGLNWGQFGLRPVSAGWVFGSVGLGLALTVVSALAVVAWEKWTRKSMPTAQAEFLLPEEAPPAAGAAAAVITGPEAAPAPPCPQGRSLLYGAIGMVLLAGLATPFCEEILFRGVVYVWLSERLGWLAAMVFSAAIFGAFHLRFGSAVAVVTGLCGLVLAWAFHASDSLWPPIIIHSVFNAPKVLLLYALRAGGVRIAPS